MLFLVLEFDSQLFLEQLFTLKPNSANKDIKNRTMATIFRTASNYLKVALIFMALGLLLFVIGFATNSWKSSWNDHNTEGLWKRCQSNVCWEIRGNDFHRTIQAMECLGLIGYGLAIITMMLYFCMDLVRRRDFMQAATAFVFAGIFFAGVGFAMGCSDNRNNYLGGHIGWSMGIAMAGTASYGVAGLMLILQLCGC